MHQRHVSVEFSCRRLAKSAAFAVLVLLSAIDGIAAEQRKVAVRQFNDRAATTKNLDIGNRVADVLVAKLSAIGGFEILDRQNLGLVLQEQGTKDNEVFDEAGGVASGKLKNVNAIIAGNITAFTANVSQSTQGSFVSKKVKQTGEVELRATARLLNVQTGSVIAAITGVSNRQRVLAESSSSNLIQGVGKDSSAGDTNAALVKLVDEAVDELAESLAKQIAARAGDLPKPVGAEPVSIKVMGVEDGAVFVNKGAESGLKPGSTLKVTRTVKTSMIDPDTGKPVERAKVVCTLTLDNVEQKMSSGKCSGEVPAAGDLAAVQ